MRAARSLKTFPQLPVTWLKRVMKNKESMSKEVLSEIWKHGECQAKGGVSRVFKMFLILFEATLKNRAVSRPQ